VPTPVPEKLFHYMSAESALAMLESQKLRGLRASELDGVLELNGESSVHFDKPQLTDAVVKAACGMIFGAEAPKGDSALIAAIQRWREAERFSTEDEAKTVLQGLCAKMVDQAFVSIENDLAKWRDFCSRFVMFRLNEKVDSFYVWQQQAENFSGVALRLSIDESEPLFENLQAIKYINTRPEISTLREQVEAVIKSKDTNIFDDIEKQFLLKAPNYQREKEWRCFTTLDDASNDEAASLSLNESILKALYFGPAIKPELKEQILEQAEKTFPKLKTAQLQFAQGRFDLSL